MTRASRPATSPTEDEWLLEQPLRDAAFANNNPWRVLRIQAEFVNGFDALANLGPAVTIFGSARTKPNDPQYKKAVEVARRLGEAGLAIITGGGPGIMRAGNEGAYEAGTRSVGLNIELPFEQKLNPYVDTSIDFRYFFVRKTMLVKYAQAFVIFPGGFGTLDELFEALTLIQTGKVHNFPIVLFDTAYFGGLIDWLKTTMLREKKISEADLNLIHLTDDPAEAVDYILRAGHGNTDQVAHEQKCVESSAKHFGAEPQ